VALEGSNCPLELKLWEWSTMIGSGCTPGSQKGRTAKEVQLQ
jgi:hypothetical protein